MQSIVLNNISKNTIYMLKKIYLKHGEFHYNIYKNFLNVYSINIYNFDIKTIKTRIQFVQQHEV